jgi:hypothetical protein
MNKEQKILNSPFDIKIHKETFINYLEVIILENGTVVYAVPSHQGKLIKIACDRLQITREELNDLCPKEYYFDFMNWLCKISNCVSLWNETMIGKANEKQEESIEILIQEKLYRGNITI